MKAPDALGPKQTAGRVGFNLVGDDRHDDRLHDQQPNVRFADFPTLGRTFLCASEQAKLLL
jgi:hypothetical protein